MSDIIATAAGIALPTPDSYKLTLADVDSSASQLNAAGHLNRSRIRAKRPRVDVGWEKLTAAQLSTIISATDAAKFSFTYYNGTNYDTGYFYRGDLVMTLLRKNGAQSYWSLSLAFIGY